MTEKIPSVSTEQMREVDRLMIEEYGIELLQMMENAGRGLAELGRRLSGGSVFGKSIMVLSGPGNNGGGGLVAARHLHNWGARVRVVLAGDADRLKDVPAKQWHITERLGLERMSFEPRAADLIIDALLGYGLSGDPRPPISGWIETINGLGIPILSLDAPSGLDTTTGEPGSPCVQASATLTLALPKTGLLTSTARQFVGDLYLADISVPPGLYASPTLGLQAEPLFVRDSIIRVE